MVFAIFQTQRHDRRMMIWKKKRKTVAVTEVTPPLSAFSSATPLDTHRFRAAVRVGLLLDQTADQSTANALFAVQTAGMQVDIHPDAFALRMAWQRGTQRHGDGVPTREGSGIHLHLVTDPLTRVAIGARLADHMPYEVLAQAWPHRSAQRFAADLAEQAHHVYRQHTMNPTVPHSTFTAIARLIDAGGSVAQIMAMERFGHDDVDAVAAFFDDFRAAARRLTACDGAAGSKWCLLLDGPPHPLVPSLDDLVAARSDAPTRQVGEALPVRMSPAASDSVAAAGMHTLRRVTVFRSVATFATVAGITACVVVGGLVALSRVEHAPAVLGAETGTRNAAAVVGATTPEDAAAAMERLDAAAAAAAQDAAGADMLDAAPDAAAIAADLARVRQ